MKTKNSDRNQKTPNASKWRASSAGVLLALAQLQPGSAQTINSGIIDPTNTYAGRTYSQWSAAWWQYYMSLPATNNPFNLSAGYPRAPLSTAQSGPVWFLGGNYFPSGTYNYTDTVPGGVALYVMIASVKSDNVNCPAPNNYDESQLRAMAQSTENEAASLSCVVDGVPVTSLASVMTTPYRVQSPVFTYICPPRHNVLSDVAVFDDTCYQNNLNMSYSIDGAVADGVYLMVAPLSAGSHTIHVTRSFPSTSPPYIETYTYQLTVQPVALTANPGNLGGKLLVSWPQSPDTYTLETSSDLDSPAWHSATNLSLVLTNGIYRATAPIGATNQFFRLRLN